MWEAKKTNKQKTHKHFSDGPCGTIVPGTNPHPSQGQTGQNGDFTVEFNRKRPACPRDGSRFVPGTGLGLSQRRVPFVPNTVPRKMFMCIGDFLARIWTRGGRTFLKKCPPAGTGTKIGFPSETRLLERRILECKRKPDANANVLGRPRFSD